MFELVVRKYFDINDIKTKVQIEKEKEKEEEKEK